jgi:hypothetical protein
MAFPERLVFTPFVVVVGSRYFFPAPECLLKWLASIAVIDFLLH